MYNLHVSWNKELTKNLFLLSWKKLGPLILLGLISTLLHNLISGLFGKEEVFFFILTVFVIPLYLLIAVITTLVSKIGNRDVKTNKE
jgi:hypothetical protein